MKKIKRTIILVCIFLIAIMYIIYKIVSNNEYQEIDLNESIINSIGKEDLDNSNYIVLHITGEIVNPGIVKIAENSRVVDAIEAAGGITENADLNKINLAFILKDGLKLYIPSIYDEEDVEYITEDIGEYVKENISIIKNGKVNINTATQSELETLPGIGASTALKIIDYRKENGKFNNIEEIKNVPGIGENKFKTIKDKICI